MSEKAGKATVPAMSTARTRKDLPVFQIEGDISGVLKYLPPERNGQ